FGGRAALAEGRGAVSSPSSKNDKRLLLAGFRKCPSMTALRMASEFATSPSAHAFPRLQAGSGPADAETQDPVESPQTLVHDRRAPGDEGWDPSGPAALVLGPYRFLPPLPARA